MPSRFLDDLPEEHVDVAEPASYGGYGAGGPYGSGGGYGMSRFDKHGAVQLRLPHARLAARASQPRSRRPAPAALERQPLTIEGELIAKSVIGGEARFATGDRVFHQKFGPGTVSGVDGNKLTVDFDKAGQKRVVDSFVEAA